MHHRGRITGSEAVGFNVSFSHGGQTYRLKETGYRAEAELACDVLAVKAAVDEGRPLASLRLRTRDDEPPPSTRLRPGVARQLRGLSWEDLTAQLQACCDIVPRGGDDDCSGASLAHAAAWRGHLALLRLLLLVAPEVAVQPEQDSGTVPLMAAAQGGQAEAVQLLLEAAPGSAQALDGEDRRPLHWAALARGAAAIPPLLRAAPQVTLQPDEYQKCPLHWAAWYGGPEAVRLLLEAAPQVASMPDEEGSLPLHGAANAGDAASVRLLLAAAPGAAMHANRGWELPLHDAARSGSPEAVEALLAAAPQAAGEVQLSGASPLHLAADVWAVRDMGGAQRAFELLLAAAPQAAHWADERGRSVLHVAAETGTPRMVQLLLEEAPDAAWCKDDKGRIPLAVALDALNGKGAFGRGACCSRLEAARALVGHGHAAVELSLLERAGPAAAPLFADYVSARLRCCGGFHWGLLPRLCPGLAPALPAALEVSTWHARQLVRRLPRADRRRLQAAALCLARAQRRHGTPLPTPLVQRLLGLAMCE